MAKKIRRSTENPATHYTKWAAADDAAVASLCEIAARLGVPIVTPRRCPDSGERNWKNITGMYVAAGHVRMSKDWERTRRTSKDLGRTLRMLHVKPPVIILRSQTAATLAHEVGHAVSMFDTMIDSRMDRRVSPLLRRLCERHGIVYYGEDDIVQLAEMRARCLEHRLMGKTLPPTLRRFCERAWQELERIA